MKINKKMNSQLNNMFNIPKWMQKESPAAEMAALEKRFKGRNDSASIATKEELAKASFDKQEYVKQLNAPQQPQGPTTQQFADGGTIDDYYGTPEEQAKAQQFNQGVDAAAGTVASINPIVGAGFAATNYLMPDEGKVGNQFQEGSEAFFKPWRSDKFRNDNKEILNKRGHKQLTKPGSMVFMGAMPGVGGALMKKGKEAVATFYNNERALDVNSDISGRGASLGSGTEVTNQFLASKNTNSAAYGGKIDKYAYGGSLCGGPGQVPCKEEKQGFDWLGLTNSVLGAAGAAYGAGAFGGTNANANGGKINQYVNAGVMDGCGGPGQPLCPEPGGTRADGYPMWGDSQVGTQGGPRPENTLLGSPKAQQVKALGVPTQRAQTTELPEHNGNNRTAAGKTLDWMGRNYDNVGMLIPVANMFRKFDKAPTTHTDRLNPNYKKTPTDLAANTNLVAEQTSAQRRALAGSSVGSATAYKRGATGINAGGVKAVSEAYRAGEQVNREQQHAANVYGQDAAKFNSAAGERDKERAAQDFGALQTAKSNNRTAIMEDLAKGFQHMGNEQTIKTMFGYTRKGKYWYKPSGKKASDAEVMEAHRMMIGYAQYKKSSDS